MKKKVIVSNSIAVITLDSIAFQMLVNVISEAGYENLLEEIVQNTEIKLKGTNGKEKS